MLRDDTIQTQLRQKQTTVQYPTKRFTVNKTLPTVTSQHVITPRHSIAHVTTKCKTHQHPVLSPLLPRQGGDGVNTGLAQVPYQLVDDSRVAPEVHLFTLERSLLANKVSEVTTTWGNVGSMWGCCGVNTTHERNLVCS